MALQKWSTLEVLSARQAPTGRNALRRFSHRQEFNYTPRPGFLYVRSRAISSRCNDNFDEFPAEEIKKAYRTFIGKPVFVNHNNENHRRARGVIIDAALHEDRNPDGSPDTWAEVLMEVDAVKFPKLAKAILAGHIDRTSMGTDVAHSLCSVCGNRATTPAEYCHHIPKMKGQRVFRFNASTGAREGVLVREICYGLGFFENSLLVEEPADPTAFTWMDQPGVTAAKFASFMAKQTDLSGPRPPIEFFKPPVVVAGGVYGTYTPTRKTAKTPQQFAQGVMDEFERLAAENKGGGKGKDATDGPTVAGVAVKARDTGRLLMLQRDASDEKDPAAGRWEFPGGHMDKDDRDLYDAAVREWQEETGHHFPEGEPGGVWDSPPVYRGFLHHVPSEDSVPIHDLNAKQHINPDDPDGDKTESLAWMDPNHLPKNPAVRDEVRKGTDWKLLGADKPEKVAVRDPFAVLAGTFKAADETESDDPFDTSWMHGGEGDWVKPAEDDDGPYEGQHRGPYKGKHRASFGEASGYVDPFDNWLSRGPRAKLGYGETRAPADVDTLRDEECPVCGESDAYDGNECQVCGFIAPPTMFQDPDLDKAKQLDLRKDIADENAADPNGDGMPDVIPGSGVPGTDRVPMDANELPDPNDVGQAQVNQILDQQSPLDPSMLDQNGLPMDDQQPELMGENQDEAENGPGMTGDSAADLICPACQYEAPGAAPQTVTMDDPMAPNPDSTDAGQGGDGMMVGDVCPNCGQATMVPILDFEQEAGMEPQPGAMAEEGAPEQSNGQPEGINSSDAPEEGAPADDDDEDDDEDEGNPVDQRKSSPKGQKASAKMRRSHSPDGGSKTVGNSRSMHTAAQAQQRQIQVLQSEVAKERRERLVLSAQLAYVAKLAGLSDHLAAIRKRADADNPAEPVPNPPSEPAFETTEQALAPETNDDVQNVGMTPGSTRDLGADYTTTPMVVGEDPGNDTQAFNELQNVTAPVAGTETQLPLEQTRIETDVRTNPNPMNPETAFPWTIQGAAGSRTMASIRLAKLQIAAGIQTGDELGLGAQIEASKMSDQAIAHEIHTLSQVQRVAGLRAQAAQQARPQNLVPRVAAGGPVQRTVPSLVGAAPGVDGGIAAMAGQGISDVEDADLFLGDDV